MEKSTLRLLLCLLLIAGAATANAADRPGSADFDRPSATEQVVEWFGGLVNEIREGWHLAFAAEPHSETLDVSGKGEGAANDVPQGNAAASEGADSGEDGGGLPEAGPVIEPVG